MVLDDFDRARHIRRLMLYAVTASTIYETWEFAFRLQEMGQTLRECAKFGNIDITGFTTAQLDTLEFGLWSDDEGDPAKGLRVIPIWLYPYLKPGQELTSIDGTKLTLGNRYNKRSDDPGYMDNDNRGGFLAYGIIPKE